jgi:ABC-2 type transport system ATP-binding protein
VVRRGVTVLISTPYMDEAERCHLVGMLYQGRMLAGGTPEELVGGMGSKFLEVKASPRKVMRRIVSATPGVLAWRPVGDCLRVETAGSLSAMEKVRANLAEQFRSQGVEVQSLMEVRPMMEDLFVRTVLAQESER